jgi:DNA-binding transcriptional LysR family regulator
MKSAPPSPRPNAPAARLDWGDLQHFVAVCTQGSIAAAAQHLQVNHSTVLRRLAALEQSLGARLFDRQPQGYVRTAAGETLWQALPQWQEQIDAAERRVRGQDESIAGVIRLTTTDTLAHALLMPVIAAFRARHPAVEVEIVVNNAFLSLTRREADVAVRGSNHPPENLIGRLVGDIQTALYASRAYLDAHGAVLDVRAADWVAPDASLAHLEQARWVLERIPAERVRVRIDSLGGMVDAVAHGLGIGLLLCPLADARAELVRLAEPEPALDTGIWVLTHPELREVARVRAFTQFLADALRADPRLRHR